MEKGPKENKATKPVIYRYIGGGVIPDIPARDFTEAEAKHLGILQTIKTSPLWAKDGE